MLLSQALALNGIFAALATRASRAMDTNMVAADFSLRLALRAQAQSRATLETLANVKNPRAVAFVRQANIAHGPQQVNNDGRPATPVAAHAEEAHSAQNKLLEHQDGERLEFGAQGTASGADPHLASVVPGDRAY
jgi:hypothetical protein